MVLKEIRLYQKVSGKEIIPIAKIINISTSDFKRKYIEIVTYLWSSPRNSCLDIKKTSI